MTTSFSLDIDKFAEKAGANYDQVFKKTVIDLADSIIKDTPVDTGRLRGNWQYSQGQSIRETDSTTNPSGKIRSEVAASNNTDVAYIGNNLPYAEDIEFGGSPTKAPQGMVRKNVARFQRFVNGAVRDLDV